MRVVLTGVVMCAALVACDRDAAQPRPTGTLEPSITESSAMPTANPNNPACKLLTRTERAELVGQSMDAEVAVRPQPGTEECVWVHSLREPARAAIRVVIISPHLWIQQVEPQIRAAIIKPTTSRSLARKLEDSWLELKKQGPDGSADDICETYLLLGEAYGSRRETDTFYYHAIGALPAAYGVSCEEGRMTIAGYGEFGLRPSLALNHGVIRLVQAAKGRAAEVGEGDDADGESPGTATSDEPEDGADTANESPEPSPTDESDAEADDES